jgi:tetratricopeptide (TPR) repeat protein
MPRFAPRLAFFSCLVTVLAVLPPHTTGQSVAQSGGKKSGKGHNYAFLVAVQDYDSEELRPLEYTRQDLKDFRQVLRGSSFPADNIVFLHDKQKYRYLPLAENIRKELNLLLERVEEGDTLVVALSGHGVQLKPKGAKQGTAYFCPVNASLKDPKTLISLEELYRRLEDCRAGRKLLLVDACRNDPLVKGERGLPQVNLETLSGQKLAVPKGTAALFSCSAGERSFEQDELKHGVFFYHVIKGWQGAAADKDGQVTLEGLAAYAKRETKKYVSLKRRTLQRPYLRTSLEDEWILHALDLGLTDCRRGEAALGEKEYDHAISYLDRAIARNPKLAKAYDLRGSAFRGKGNLDGAARDYAEAHRLDPELPTRATELAEAYTQRGAAFLQKPDYDRAVAELTHAIRTDPRFAWAYKLRARAYRMDGKPDQAIADCTEALLLNAEDAWAHNERGLAYAAKKDYDAALAEYTKSIRTDPKQAVYYCNRGDVYQARGQHGQAIAEYSHAVRLNPKYAVAYNNRGASYASGRQYRHAIADYTKAIRLNPRDARYHRNRGDAYVERKKYSRAVTDYTAAIRLDPKNFVFFNQRGLAHRGKKQYKKALADFNKALRLNPNAWVPHNNRGIVYHDKKQYRKAITAYNKAIRLNPQYGQAYFNRGNAYSFLGKRKQARANWQKAKQLGYKK